MPDPVVWYLVIELLSPLGLPERSVAGQLVGPITEAQCDKAKAALGPLPDVVHGECRKAIGMRSTSDGSLGYIAPIFEGDMVGPK